MTISGSKAGKRAKRGAEQLTKGFRGVFGYLFVVSGIINILALTGSFYMLQIYDRALTRARSRRFWRSRRWQSVSICSRACST